MKRVLLVFVSIVIYSNSFAQFPNIKPTYKPIFIIEDEMDLMLDSVAKSALTVSGNRIDVRTASNLSKFYLNRANSIESEIEKLEEQNDTLEDSTDSNSLAQIYNNSDQILKLKDSVDHYKELSGLFYAVNKINGRPKFFNSFFPVRNRYQSNYFFNQVKEDKVNFMNSVVLQGNEDRASIFADLASGTIGLARVSFSSVFYTGNNSDSLELITKILNGGGLTNLRVEIPLFFKNSKNFTLYVSSKPGAIGDIPIFGSEIPKSKFVGYFELPIESYLEIRTNEDNLGFFGNLKVSQIRGTKAFYEGVKSPSDNPLNGRFWLSQIYFGINVRDKYRISANVPIATTNSIVIPEAIQVGIQINDIGLANKK